LKEQRQSEAALIHDAIQTAMLDSGASRHFVKTTSGLTRTGSSIHPVVIADGSIIHTTDEVQLPLHQLRDGARQTFVLPNLRKQALMSVKSLADNGYTTIFHPFDQGVTVHDNDDFKLTLSKPAILQGWQDAGGLSTVPLVSEPKSLEAAKSAMTVYELPSNQEVVRFLHAALGFPTKATLLTAARHRNLITFPGMTVDNINRHFPESFETQ